MKPGKRRREVAPRLDDYVEKCLGRLMSYCETVDAAMDEFDCAASTVERSIARVKAQWLEVERQPLEERRAKFSADLAEFTRQAMAAGDHRAVAMLQKVRADVEGVKAPKKVEHSGVLGLRPVAAMSPQEREREIEILMAKKNAPPLTNGHANGHELISGDDSQESAPEPTQVTVRKKRNSVH